jgi:hypothetical protein
MYTTRPSLSGVGLSEIGVVFTREKTGTRIRCIATVSTRAINTRGVVMSDVMQAMAESLTKLERGGGWKLVSQCDIPASIWLSFSPNMKLE